MIRPDKLDHALYALSGIVVESRAMLENGRPVAEIADVLDFVEYLPPLLATPDDSTDAFRAFLEGLAACHPEFAFVIERFDADRTPHGWWS